MAIALENLKSELSQVADHHVFGRVTAVLGIMVQVGGIERYLSVGDRCDIHPRGHEAGKNGRLVPCEVVGFRDGEALVMPFTSLDGVGLGCRVEVAASQPVVYPTEAWLGRVINALGEPIDGKGPLPKGPLGYPIRALPPPAHSRKRIGDKMDLGVRAMNTFLTCCKGQRLGIFAGSGIGKSILLSMLARFTAADVNVIGLVGERGREVQEFLEDDLGPEGLARSLVIVATSDESALMRRQAAYLTMACAESFRDAGQDVLCLMDSVTRFAMSQREIGLSAGEPPASKGYTPTVFAELPRLLERAGPGQEGQGSVTGLFTVLVEGDDHNEPVSDAVRGILDGHIVLDRAIAERGRYPAINVLRSVSRALPDCNSEAENALLTRARALMSTYEDMAELIRIGAYRQGADPSVDEAIHYVPHIESFLSQDQDERAELTAGYRELAGILNLPDPNAADPAAGPAEPEAGDGATSEAEA
ncbi:MAG: flagellar protein export ATPase FliI [Alphaproteobacteria bacterium]|nr:flagellar protein export ATPase FliI [Alphaproteobacteria bacterium]